VYHLLPWFFVAQGLIYVGTPLKQFLNAKEKFTPYGVIAIISNAGKIIACYILQYQHKLNINTVVIMLICAAVFELGGLLYYTISKTTFSFKVHIKAYVKLLKEASPQYMSVLFDMSLSRIDWILLGMMTTNIVLADYSFAYRSYELSKLPVVIIGPIILPRLARFMPGNGGANTDIEKHINSFFNVEMFLAMLIPLSLNILWTPLLTLITNGKYGETNSLQFLILSLCIPLQFFVNLFWSVCFSAKQYKKVSYITICCAVTNIVLNLVLIPKYGGLGAAISFLTTNLLQAVLYYRLVLKQIMRISLGPLLLFAATGTIVYLFAIWLPVHFMLQLLIAIIAYLLIAVLSKRVTMRHFNDLKQFLS
jgi:O-antigen/teichoic acid export membrane protein